MNYEQRRALRGRRYGNPNPFTATRTIHGVDYAVGAHNSDMKELLGHDPKKHWPDEGVEPQWVQGYLVKVLPKTDQRLARRTLAQCPHCERWVCAGHVGQHMLGKHAAEEYG